MSRECRSTRSSRVQDNIDTEVGQMYESAQREDRTSRALVSIRDLARRDRAKGAKEWNYKSTRYHWHPI